MGWILNGDVWVERENIEVSCTIYVVAHEAGSVLAASHDDNIFSWEFWISPWCLHRRCFGGIHRAKDIIPRIP